jgi:hypothetical protein
LRACVCACRPLPHKQCPTPGDSHSYQPLAPLHAQGTTANSYRELLRECVLTLRLPRHPNLVHCTGLATCGHTGMLGGMLMEPVLLPGSTATTLKGLIDASMCAPCCLPRRVACLSLTLHTGVKPLLVLARQLTAWASLVADYVCYCAVHCMNMCSNV